MKIRIKSSTAALLIILAATAIAALRPALSYAQGLENFDSREAYRQMQLLTDGRVPEDGVANAQAWVASQMVADPDAWEEFPSAVAGLWTKIGPGNIGGRIRALVIRSADPTHPTEARTIWLGGVEGGVWKSTDSGTTWATNTDLLSSNAVNCLAIHPANPNVLFAGTGEGFGNLDAAQGNGIFKTVDGGTTWAQIPSTSNAATGKKFAWVNGIAFNPANPQIMLAATRVYPPQGGAPSGQIQRSTDGGVTWTAAKQGGTVLSSDGAMVSVRFKPRNTISSKDVPAINCLATTEKGVLYYSIDAGANWTVNAGNGFPPPVWLQRLEVAYSRSNPDIVYALKAGVYESGEELFRSDDGGYRFKSLGQPFDRTPDGGGTAQASWYANTLWVDPFDWRKVVVAGIGDIKSDDGGMTWTSMNGLHPDYHTVVEDPGYNGSLNSVVYYAGDGGVARTTNLWPQCPTGVPCVQWQSLNHGLGITQFYGAAGHNATGIILGGSQDNGTDVYSPPPLGGNELWFDLAGGDGGMCAIDQTVDPRFYGEYYSGKVFRTDGRSYAEPIWFGIPEPCDPMTDTPCANFTAPLILDPNPGGENRLLLGGKSLWLNTNPRTGYYSWVTRKNATPTNYINAIAMAKGQPGVVWVGHNDGQIFYSLNGTAIETPAWLSADPNHNLPSGDRPCTHITLGAGASDPVYATFGGFYPSFLNVKGNVWQRNADGSWTDISTNLPSCPVYTLVVSRSNPNTLYVGTEVGVFAGVKTGANVVWSPGIHGSPAIPGLEIGGPVNTRVADMFYMERGTQRQLVIATHGLGMLILNAYTQ